MTVYLCGGIYGLSDAEASDWRASVTARLSSRLTVLNPLRRDYRGLESGLEAEIVNGDLADIDAADILIVNAVRPSWGTAMEVFYAHRSGKRVLAFGCGDRPSPWLRHHCTALFETLSDCLEALSP